MPKEATQDEWLEDRIWQELEVRLAACRPRVSREHGALLLSVIFWIFVSASVEPMQKGHVFLAGDAAHMVKPAGGKGMKDGNLSM